MVHAEFFCETSNHWGDSAQLDPRFGALWLLASLKTKITFEREEISDHWWDSGKYDGQLMAIGRTVWGPKVPTLKGTEVSLSCVQCFLYLVFSSVNVSTFHITWLDTFWTDLIYFRDSFRFTEKLWKQYRVPTYPAFSFPYCCRLMTHVLQLLD